MKKEKTKHKKKAFLWTGRCYLLVFVNLLLVVVFTFTAYSTLGANVNKYLGYKLDEPSIKHYMEELDYDYPESDIKVLRAEQTKRLSHLDKGMDLWLEHHVRKKHILFTRKACSPADVSIPLVTRPLQREQ